MVPEGNSGRRQKPLKHRRITRATLPFADGRRHMSHMSHIALPIIALLALLAPIQVNAMAPCPNGSYVGGGSCVRAPDGSYISGDQRAQRAPNGIYTTGRPVLTPKGNYIGG